MRKSIEIVTLLILLFMKCTTANFLEYDDCIGWGLDVGRRRGSTKTKNDHPSKHKDATTFVRNLEPVKHHRKRTIPSKKTEKKSEHESIHDQRKSVSSNKDNDFENDRYLQFFNRPFIVGPLLDYELRFSHSFAYPVWPALM